MIAAAACGGSGGGGSASTATTLGGATRAGAGLSTPVATVGPGQFWYSRTTAVRRLPVPVLAARPPSVAQPVRPAPLALGGLVSVVQRETTETWVGLDGTVRTRTLTVGPPTVASTQDRARLRASGLPLPPVPGSSDVTVQGDGRFPAGQDLFTYRELLALPTDPRALYRQLHRALAAAAARGQREYAQTLAAISAQRSGATGGHEATQTFSIRASESGAVLDAVAGLLDDPVPAPVRAALYRAAELAPGVRLDGPVKDSLGRPGIGISTGPPSTRLELIVDPATGALLGQRSRLAGDSTTVVAGVAPSIDGVPAGATRVPGPPSLARVPIAVVPAIGGPRSTFTLHVGQPAGTGRYTVVVSGPSRPSCRTTLIPTILGTPERPASGAGLSSTLPIAPPARGAAGRAWCPGSYEAHVQSSVPGRGSGELGSVRFRVR